VPRTSALTPATVHCADRPARWPPASKRTTRSARMDAQPNVISVNGPAQDYRARSRRYARWLVIYGAPLWRLRIWVICTCRVSKLCTGRLSWVRLAAALVRHGAPLVAGGAGSACPRPDAAHRLTGSRARVSPSIVADTSPGAGPVRVGAPSRKGAPPSKWRPPRPEGEGCGACLLTRDGPGRPAPHCRERTALYPPLPTRTSPVVAAGSWPPSSGSPLTVALPM
jgi:hypothetical protein